MVRLIVKLNFYTVLLLFMIFGPNQNLNAINKLIKLPGSLPVVTENQDFNSSLIRMNIPGKETQKMGHGIKKVVLDAGHGGKDIGTKGKDASVYEKRS